ncbi:MAG TPA: ABC transporter substrate-binding protein [Thermodesulfobacteriota bacterium]|nr:ABC transporter substrate-binding protein [Thermodesulfobacteriota bacterium]
MKNRSTVIALGMAVIVFLFLALTPAKGAQKAINISYIGNFNQPWGKSGLTSARMAIDEINVAGGIAGRPLNLLSYDNKGQIPLTVAGYKKAVMTDGSLIIFTEGSEHVLACQDAGAELFKEFPHIQMGVWTSADSVTNRVVENPAKFKFFFRAFGLTSLNMGIYINSWAKLYKDQGYKKIAVLLEDLEFTALLRKGDPTKGILPLKAQWEKLGFKISYAADVASTEKMWLPIMEKVASSGAQAMCLVSVYADLTAMAKQWAQSAAKNIAICNTGGAASLGQPFWDMTGGAALGWVSGVVSNPDLQITDKTKAFFTKLLKEYRVGGFENSYNTYEGIYFMKSVIEKVGNAEDIAAIIEAAEATEVPGVVGSMKFDAKSHTRYYTVKGDGYPYYTIWNTQYQKGGTLVTFSPQIVADKTNPGKGFLDVGKLRQEAAK